MIKESVDFKKEGIYPLIFKLSFPAIMAMIAMGVNNVVDGIYLGRFVGENALGATSVILPIQLILMGIFTILPLGASSLIARSRGSNDQRKFNESLSTVITASLILGLVVVIVMYIFNKYIVGLFAPSTLLFNEARAYYLGSVFSYLYLPILYSYNNVYRALGDVKRASMIMILGIVLNIIFTPIFIIVFDLGILGAALGTSIANFFGFVVGSYFFKKYGFFQIIKDLNFKVNLVLLKEMVAIGFSSFVRQIAGSLVITSYNYLFFKYGNINYVNSFGVVYKINQLIVLPMFGFLQGIQPIVGYFYGSNDFPKSKEAIKKSVIVVFGFSLIVSLIVILNREFVISLFTKSSILINIGSQELLYFMALLSFVSLQLVVTSIYQAIGKPKEAIYTALLRQLFLGLPLIFLCSYFWGYKGILISFIITDLLSGTISLLMIKSTLGNIGKLVKS